MVRVPSLPFNTLNKIENYNSIKELTNSIRFDININDLLMISNLALYNTYKCKKLTKKTEKQLNMSIKNYIRRTVTRPTPFGISSGVEMGYFADKTNLVLDSNGFMNFAKIDTEWLYKLVYLIQSDKRNLDRLFFYSNQDLHTIGNMIKNNDVVDISNSMNNMSEILIKKSYLIEEILELCERGIRGDILKRKVMNDYSGVSEEKVDKIINNLIDCGYLITDLFPIAFHEDSLKHILDWLNKNRPCSELLSSLLKIERYISKYNHDNNIEHLKYIYSIMEKIVSSNNYVHVTRKLSLREKTISVQVKEEVERFINNISRINISKCDRYKKFKYKFLDTYGYNSKINILDLFEENRNGLIYDIYQLEYLDVQDCENYLSIKSYIRNSINEAIINGKDEVYLDTEKLISLCVKEGEDKYEYIDTFDINFILRKEHNKHDIILAPIASSNRAGQMINRFSCVLDNNLYDEYLSFIRRCDKSIENKKNISLVEIREITNQTRMLNIRNYEKITDSHLPISIKTHWNGKINIKDIFVYIDINNKINVIDNKTGNNIKIVSNDMLNSYTKSRLNKILYNLTNNEISVLDVIRSAINNEFTYIPRVKIDDIYINMKRWKVENNLLNTENIVSFKDKIKEIFEMYKIPQYVYLTDDDNRLLINICDETDLEYIYKYSRKREISLFEEVEYDKDHQPVVKDERLQRFCSEITVSVYNEENDIKKKMMNICIKMIQ